MTPQFVDASVPAAVSTTIAIAVDSFKEPAFSAVDRLSARLRLAGTTANTSQSGHGRTDDEENGETEEYFAHVFASSPNDFFEGTLR
ncbi:hypothetical protein [Ensifer canadensis]